MCEEFIVQYRSGGTSSENDQRWYNWDLSRDQLSFTPSLHGDKIEVRVKPVRKPEYWRSKTTGNIYKDTSCSDSVNFEPVEVEVKPWHA